jgi:hypothetical protein
MTRPHGITDIAPRWVIARFIGKCPVKDEKFFAAAVGVGAKAAPWGVADDRGGTGDFRAIPFQHSAIDTGQRRSNPVEILAVNHRSLGKVGVNV